MNTEVYRVWRVYEDKVGMKFYIINTKTHKVQSIWDDMMKARQVVFDLNCQYIKDQIFRV